MGWKDKEHKKECDNKRMIGYAIVWRAWFIENGHIPFPCQGFEYHHIIPKTKKFKIGAFTWKYPCTSKWQVAMKEELEKCVLLSIKEHRILHGALRRKEGV